MIPYEGYGGSGSPLHFLHANGYPPAAYRPLLDKLSIQYTVCAMRMRPLWPEADPNELHDWLPLANDLGNFLNQQGWDGSAQSSSQALIGAGHSVGATTTLRLALQKPGLFRALVLIDPVLFPPWMSLLWKLIARLGLAHQVHPLIKSALRRRNTFDTRQAMFDNYRKKGIFSRLPDDSLWAYVDSLACDVSGDIQLCYPPEWEARIYATGALDDMALWRALPGLPTPVLLLRGELSNAFWPSTARLFQRKLPNAQIITIPNTTHLLPLEQPAETARIINQYLSAVL